MKALEEEGISKDDFFTLAHGDSKLLFCEKDETDWNIMEDFIIG